MTRRVRIIGGPEVAPPEEGVAEVGDLSSQDAFIEAEDIVAARRESEAQGYQPGWGGMATTGRYPPRAPRTGISRTRRPEAQRIQ